MPLTTLREAVQLGRRVFLRKPVARDRDEYLTLRRRSAVFLGPWEPLPSRGSTTAQHFGEWLRTSRRGRHEKLLVCRIQDEALLGAINVNEIVRGPAPRFSKA